MSKSIPFIGMSLIVVVSIFLWIKNIVVSYTVIGLTLETSLVQITGLLAFVFFVFSLVLSVRVRWIEKLFAGFDVLYRYHKYVGISAFLLAVFHFGLVLIGKENILDYIWITQNNDLNDLALNLGIVSLYGIIVLMVLTYISALPYHIWKLTHQFMGIFFIAGMFHSILIKTVGEYDSLYLIWMIILGVIGTLAYVYSVLLWKWFPSRYKYRVIKKIRAGKVTQLFLEPVEDRMEWWPGQIVYATIPSISSESHPYSFSTTSTNKIVRLSIKNLGQYTSRISEVTEGEKVILNGPYGSFGEKFMATTKPVVMIAGGIGITPFMSMIKHRVESGKTGARIDVWYCTHSNSETIFLDELRELASGREDIIINTWYSDEKGILDPKTVFDSVENPSKTLWYTCGPRPLMVSFLNGLIKLGVRKSAIMLEDFSFKK